MSLGFGAYRVSSESKEHFDALKLAIDEGVKLIDTSTNYTNTQSEKLIGTVLKEVDNKPLIISKVGYIQGDNLAHMKSNFDQLQYKDEIVQISDHLWHCIAPGFIKEQLLASLSRLGLDSIEAYLLHNPEYFFEISPEDKKEYYRRIENAFVALEELVKEGLITSYGVSSNNFVLSPTDKKLTHIDEVYQCALNAGSKEHHFKWVQFPLNIIEVGALQKSYDGFSFLDKAKGMGLTTMSNRPLNAFKDDKLVRLATYENFVDFNVLKESKKQLNTCLDLLEKKVKEQDEHESIHELPIIKQFCGLWDNLPTPDAVEQVFYAHFFPLVAKIWGKDLGREESQPFYDLFDLSLLHSRKRMSEVANDFSQAALKSGLLSESNEPLQQQLIKKYFEYGVDYVLVGMKKEAYVKQMKNFF